MIRRVLKTAALVLVAASPLASCALANEADSVIDREADTLVASALDRAGGAGGTPTSALVAGLTVHHEDLSVDVLTADGTLDAGSLVLRIRAVVEAADFHVAQESTRCFRYALHHGRAQPEELRPCPDGGPAAPAP